MALNKGAASDNTMKNNPVRLVIAFFLNIITMTLVSLFFAVVLLWIFGDDTTDIVSTVPYKVLPSILGFIFFCIAVYSTAWRFGARDMNLVKYNHIKERRFIGLICGLIAMLPSAVLLLMVFSARNQDLKESLQSYFELAHFYFSWLFVLAGYRPGWYILTLCAAPPAAMWGYYNGYRYISIRRMIVYKDPRKKDAHSIKKDKRLR